MPALPRPALLRPRAEPSSSGSLNPTITSLLIALLTLLVIAILCIITLFVLRSIRRKRTAAAQASQGLPTSRKPSHRRLAITATPFGRRSTPPSICVTEKQAFLDSSAPQSPVPEIRITLPDEVDGSGEKKEGRVVVVRIADNGGVGLEPCAEEPLPPYQRREGEDGWKSLDLERMGGLREKERPSKWS